MDGITILGLVAGTLTTLAFIPQVARIWKSRRTLDISLPMYSMFCLGILLWLIYGIVLRSPPIIAANAVSLAFAVAILAMKLRYG